MKRHRRKLWRVLRLLFRWGRIAVWLVLLATLVAFIYLNQAGLPDFLKTRLRAELRARGADLQFERLRLRWYRGIVADTVTLGAAGQPDGPRLHLGEVALRLNRSALRQFQLRIDSLGIREGRLLLPLNESNQSPSEVVLDNISTELRFLPGDRWELDEFEATLLDARIRISGTLTNATALPRLGPAGTPVAGSRLSSVWKSQLRSFVAVWKDIHFAAPPDLRLAFRGDARDPAGFVAELKCHAVDARTPYGQLDDLLLTAQLNRPLATNGWFNTSTRLVVANVQTKWGQARQAHLAARWSQSATNALPAWVDWELSIRDGRAPWASCQSAQLSALTTRIVRPSSGWETGLRLSALDLKTDWGQSHTNSLSARVVHSPTNFIPVSGAASIDLGRIQGPWGAVEQTLLTNVVWTWTTPPRPASGALGPWAPFFPLRLNCDAEVNGVRSPKLHLDRLVLSARWDAPRLAITNLAATLYEGRLSVPTASLDTATREFAAQAELDLDVHRLALLPESARRWLDQFTWAKPPHASGSVRLTFPAWANTHPDWQVELMPTLVVDAAVRGDQAGYRGVSAAAVQTAVHFSNQVWHLPDLTVSRPEGSAVLDYTENTLTHDYRLAIRSRIDLNALRPLLDESVHNVLDLFTFTSPPAIEGEILGRWHVPERSAFGATVAITNFVFSGERCNDFSAAIAFSNLFLVATNVSLHRDAEWISAPGVGFSLTNYWVYLTNAQARMDPMRVTDAIGERTSDAIRPYHFEQPPAAVVNGHVPTTGDTSDADLTFDVSGGPFHYWKFNLPQVSARVHWLGDHLTITNLSGDFYQGRISGDMAVDFVPGGDAEMRFHAYATETDLHQLLADLTTPTNRMEGTVTVNLNITSANSGDWSSWYGYGDASMRDGLLWDSPIFGLFSPLLNAVVPGLGNSRASAAKSRFSIDRSVIRTEGLQIIAAPARLAYKGTVDFDGRVNARVEAIVLRGAPIVGPLLSLAFSPITKVFEYKVTGTLGNPKSEPLYIPKFIDSILHPFRTLKGVLPAQPAPRNPVEPDK